MYRGQARERNLTRFIVHIGPHKTGTTYIQETLSALRDTLLERGVCVPSIWNAAPGLPSHLKLVSAIRNRDLTLVREQVQKILAQRYEYVVISSEDLSSLSPHEIVELRKLLDSAATTIAYYVRRWPERLPSKWQEGIKFGRTASFPEYLAEQLTKYDDSALRDTPIIDRYANVFGVNQIKVVSYSTLVDNNLDIARHFLAAFLNISQIQLPPAVRLNQSLPLVDTELIRALNSIHARRGCARSPTLRNWYLAHKQDLATGVVFGAMRDYMGAILLDERAPSLALESQDLLTRYALSIVPPRHTDSLHEPRAIDVPFIRPDYLLEPDVPKILCEIYEMYHQTL
jgi:hypothetical protein